MKGRERAGTYQRHKPFLYDPIPLSDTIRHGRTIAGAVAMGQGEGGESEDGEVTVRWWRVMGRCSDEEYRQETLPYDG